MYAVCFVPALDVSKNAPLRLFAGGEVLPVRFFNFQRMPEVLHGRVVITVSGAAYRLRRQLFTHVMTGILTPTVRMEDQSGWQQGNRMNANVVYS